MANDIFRMELRSEELDNYLSLMEKRLGNLKPFFLTLIPVLHTSIITNFRMAGRPAKWASLSPMTIATRRREKTWPGRGGTQPILQARGQLVQSIGSVQYISSHSLEYGTNLLKASALQFGRKVVTGIAHIGATIRRTKMGKTVSVKAHTKKVRFGEIPARPFILFQDSDIERIVSYASAYAYEPDKAEKLII